MASFGKSSQARLDTCDVRIQSVLNEVIKHFDFSVLEGHRSIEKQQQYFLEGKSKLDGVNQKSKHQSFPSLAADIAPYPIDFSDKKKARERFYFLMGMVNMESIKQGVEIRFGLDWDGDGLFDDQSFDDLPHFELKV